MKFLRIVLCTLLLFFFGCGSPSVVPRPSIGRSDNYVIDYVGENAPVVPHYWKTNKITYHVEGGNDILRSAVIAGANMWNRVEEPVVEFTRVFEKDKAMVTVHFLGKDQLRPGVVGYANFTLAPDGSIDHADMVVVTGRFLPYYIQLIAAHEFGHVLFCGNNFGQDHSNSINDVMAPVIRDKFPPTLTQRDVNSSVITYEKALKGELPVQVGKAAVIQVDCLGEVTPQNTSNEED
jgi:hypothetical protein